jgi:hypothetical protein
MYFPEKRLIALREGTLAALNELRRDDETDRDFMREAIDREIERRSTQPKQGL